MPVMQGISMCITTSVDEAGQPAESKFPEFPHTAPQPLQHKSSERKTSKPLTSLFGCSSKAAEVKIDPLAESQRQISVYIPLLPQAAAFRISYAFIPEFPEGVRFAYIVFFNGKHVVTADVMPQKEHRGYLCQTIGETDDGFGSNKNFKYEALGFEFAAQKRLIKKSRVEDGGLIEVRWYRIHGSKPVELSGAPPIKNSRDKYGICFKPSGPPANLKFRLYSLKDPIQEPWAAFRFYYRSWDSLREHSIVVEDEYSENVRQGPPIGDSTRSLLSYYKDEELSSTAHKAPETTMNSSLIKWTTASGSPSVANNHVPLDVALAAYFRGDAVHDISITEQGRIVTQSNANEDRRQSLLLEEAPRKSRSSTRRSVDTTDRKSMVSLTPSLKECVDREDGNNPEDVIGIAQVASVTDLAILKVRSKHASGAHTGISAQLAAMRTHDNMETNLTADHSPDKENRKAVTALYPPPRSAGIYQQNNTGLVHYGENGLSNHSICYQETSSVVDGDFAASELAPPTMHVRIAKNSRRTIGATAVLSPIETPGGHDFPVISPEMTPKHSATGLMIQSSPTKTPGGGDFPVDPPGSAGFPVIEPGEDLELSSGECGEGSMPGASSDTGSVIHLTPPRGLPKSISLPRSRKTLAAPFLSPVGGRGLNSHAPFPTYSSSPLEALEELQRLGVVGIVQRKRSKYESSKDSLPVPPAQLASLYVTGSAAGGEAAPGSGLGGLRASASLLALQDRQVDQAKSVIAAAKSKLGLHLKPKGRGGANAGGEVSGGKKIVVDDLNDTFAGDDTIESSSPIKLVRISSQKSKGKGKENTTGDDVFCPAAGEAVTPRRRPSSEDDPDHPLRRRDSLSKATRHDWMFPAHKRAKSTSTLSKSGDVPKIGKLVPAGLQDNDVAALMAFKSNEQIIVASAVVADDFPRNEVVENEADSLGNPFANDDSRAAPAPVDDARSTVRTGTSNNAGNGTSTVNYPRPPAFDYSNRVRAIARPASLSTVRELSNTGFTSDEHEDDCFDSGVAGAYVGVISDMQRDGAAIRRRLETIIEEGLS